MCHIKLSLGPFPKQQQQQQQQQQQSTAGTGPRIKIESLPFNQLLNILLFFLEAKN